MSSAFYVYLDERLDIDLASLKEDASDIFWHLLNQKNKIQLDLEFYDYDKKNYKYLHYTDEILPGDGLILTVSEVKISENMCVIYSHFDKYHEYSGNYGKYQFVVSGIRGDTDDPMIIIALSLAASVARRFSPYGVIDDGSGIIRRMGKFEDEISVEHIMSLALTEKLPLKDAITAFYQKNCDCAVRLS